MKSYFCIIILCLQIFCAYAEEDLNCNEASVMEPIDSKNIKLINQILSAADLSLKEKQKATQQLNIDNAAIFLKSLPLDQQEEMNNLLQKIKSSPTSLIEIGESDDPPILMVHGIDYNPDLPHEFIKPFHSLLQKKHTSYFFKWSKSKSIEENSGELTSTIRAILEKHKDKDLTVVGYSAGGVLTITSMDTLAQEPIAKRIHFHTVASPIFGHRAPSWAMIFAPFAGKTSISVGQGQYDKLAHKTFNQCSHWVTTRCELDLQACENNQLNPQTGPSSAGKSILPCGEDNTRSYADEGHASVLSRVFSEITGIK